MTRGVPHKRTDRRPRGDEGVCSLASDLARCSRDQYHARQLPRGCDESLARRERSGSPVINVFKQTLEMIAGCQIVLCFSMFVRAVYYLVGCRRVDLRSVDKEARRQTPL